MRRKSLTNSCHWIDEDFRTDYVREAGSMDEVAFYTGWQITARGPKEMWVGLVVPGNDPHHIAHRGRKRDWRTNLCALPREAHDQIHGGTRNEPQWGTMLCVLAKLRKQERTGEPEEFNLRLFNECLGKNIIGTIEGYNLEPRWDKWRDETLCRLDAAALELAKGENR